MAVKTPIEKDDFTGILSGYRLGRFVRSEPISEGTVQTNYIVHTTNTQLIFRYYENRPVDSVRFEVEFLNFLKNRDFPCPAPYPGRDGALIGLHRGKPYVLFEFMPGAHVSDPDDTQRNELIRIAARLNTLTAGYRSEYAKHRLTYDIETCARLAGEADRRIGTKNSGEKLKWYRSELESLELPSTHPRCICHCDFHFTNLLFQDGRISALLDFDDANITYSTFDLAYLMHPFRPDFEWNTWSLFRPEADILDLARARHTVQTYSGARRLAENEKRALFDVCKLSVLVDCIWYFERGVAYDFYEKRKLDSLDWLGRERFTEALFGCASI